MVVAYHETCQGNAQEGAKGQSQGRAHAEEADAEAMVLLGHHIGYDGARGRAGDARAGAGQKAQHKEAYQGGIQKGGRYGAGKEAQSCQQDGPAAIGREQVAAEKAAHQAAYDHDAGTQAGNAETGLVGGLHVHGTGHEGEIIDGHDQQVDAGDDRKLVVADGACRGKKGRFAAAPVRIRMQMSSGHA